MSTVEDDDNKKRIDKYIDENENDCKQKDYERVFVRGKKKIFFFKNNVKIRFIF